MLRPESHQISITFFDQFNLVFKSSQTPFKSLQIRVGKSQIKIIHIYIYVNIYIYIYLHILQIRSNQIDVNLRSIYIVQIDTRVLSWEEDSPQFSRKLYIIPFWGIHGIRWAYDHIEIEGDVLLRQHGLVFKHNVEKSTTITLQTCLSA